MIIILFALIALALVFGRHLHGRGGEKWYKSKWVLFSPSLALAAGLGFYLSPWYLGLAFPVIVALGIVLFFAGAVADDTLNYMYRRDKSDLRNIIIKISWRIGLCCAVAIAGAIFGSPWVAVFVPLNLLSVYPLIHVARENRHVAGEGGRDARHRSNVEWSEGAMAAVNICSVLASLGSGVAGG
jgi:hypothetical protein